jgi:catechol 2,3-dioxygenase-like lactoylglutathione lyase family enzyme
MHMLHHVSLGVSNIEASARFYDEALAALGYVRVWSDLRPGEQGQAVGYGSAGSDDKLAIKQSSNVAPSAHGFHLAFSASEREAVHRFYEAALRNGGRDNGAPGPRPHYGQHYYAAFVVDPDGHHLEAVINTAD